MNERDIHDSARALIAAQQAYYDLRAPDFGDATAPDRVVLGIQEPDLIRSLIDEFDPRGDVLELACGTGSFTRELARHADSLTAIDSSLRMIERARHEVGETHPVRFVQADVFNWSPDRVYDAVFFANWLSHVPPTLFEDFWTLIRSCVRRTGRVAFVDEDERAVGFDDVNTLDGVPSARRTLSDGRQFDIVKVFWHPDDLSERLSALGWNAEVRRVGDFTIYGHCTSARP